MLAPHRSPCPLPVPASPRGTSPRTPGGDPQQKQPTPKAPSQGHRHTSCKKPGPGNPHNRRWGRPAPGVPSQPPVSPLSPHPSLSAPGVPSQPPGVPLRPLPQSQCPCLCSHVSSILTHPFPWPCPEPPDASSQGAPHSSSPDPTGDPTEGPAGGHSELRGHSRCPSQPPQGPRTGSPQGQAERGPGAQSHSPHDLPELNLPGLREEGAWCALV